jgi:hypothetical protein
MLHFHFHFQSTPQRVDEWIWSHVKTAFAKPCTENSYGRNGIADITYLALYCYAEVLVSASLSKLQWPDCLPL